MLERMWSKGNTPTLLLGMQTGTLDISIVISQKLGNNIPQDAAIQIMGIYPKRMLNHTTSTCAQLCT